MSYNLYVLSPFCFFLLFVMYSKLGKDFRKPFIKRLTLIVITLLLINSIGFIRQTLLYFVTKNNKVSYADFRKDFLMVSDKIKKDERIAITFSLWPYCLDKYKNITLSNSDSSVKYIMQQQLYSGQSEPRSHLNFNIIKNGFITKHPKIGKLPLGNTYPWFQYAIYQKK